MARRAPGETRFFIGQAARCVGHLCTFGVSEKCRGRFHRSELESNATRRSRCNRCHERRQIVEVIKASIAPLTLADAGSQSTLGCDHDRTPVNRMRFVTERLDIVRLVAIVTKLLRAYRRGDAQKLWVRALAMLSKEVRGLDGA